MKYLPLLFLLTSCQTYPITLPNRQPAEISARKLYLMGAEPGDTLTRDQVEAYVEAYGRCKRRNLK